MVVRFNVVDARRAGSHSVSNIVESEMPMPPRTAANPARANGVGRAAPKGDPKDAAERQRPDFVRPKTAQQAVAEAEAALEARLTEAHQNELSELRQANADEAKAFLETLGSDVGATIAARMDAMQTQVVELVSAAAGGCSLGCRAVQSGQPIRGSEGGDEL